jgi:hypothetical protein
LSDLPSASAWSFPPRPETHHARWIETDPHVEGRLFVAVEAGALIRSLDAGVTWQDRRPGGPYDTHQLQTHLRSAGRLYSAAGDGYFESRDGGNTWKQLEEGLRHKYLWSVAVDSGDADNVIVFAAASPLRSHGDSNPESYVYRRTGEQPWEKIDRGLPGPAGQHSAVLAAHPIEPGTFFAAWEREKIGSPTGKKQPSKKSECLVTVSIPLSAHDEAQGNRDEARHFEDSSTKAIQLQN